MTSSIDQLADEHLRIWNAPPGTDRDEAATNTYASGVMVCEAEAAYTGYQGLARAIDGLHAALPGMQLTRSGPIQTAQDLSTYTWALGPPGGPTIVTGRDVLIVRDGLIDSVYVLIDAPQDAPAG